MTYDTQAMKDLQQEIEYRGRGVMMVVCLVNIDELNILFDEPVKFIKKFSIIVKGICQNIAKRRIITDFDLTKIYVLMPDNIKLAERLAYTIYSQVQLYIDSEFPESYFKCSVKTIKFTRAASVDSVKLLSLLNYGSFSSADKSYYFNYDDNPVDVQRLRARNIKLNLLRSALLKKTAKFMYQPIVDCKTGNIIYYECLLRIKNENNKWASVWPMVCDAESKGLISIVDFTVVEMAILELVRDQNANLSVNISNVGVLNKSLLPKIENLLKKHKVAKRLIIEITETSVNDDFHNTKQFIDVLHKHGCRFALDDFGSGFTSFQQLFKLPIDIIKIDGSYIRDILKNDHNRVFVEALIKLASDLEVKTVAEFVENSEIAKFLIGIKVDAMQGNFFLPASKNRIT